MKYIYFHIYICGNIYIIKRYILKLFGNSFISQHSHATWHDIYVAIILHLYILHCMFQKIANISLDSHHSAPYRQTIAAVKPRCYSVTVFMPVYVVVSLYLSTLDFVQGFPGGSDGKESACNAVDPGSILGSERSPEEGNDNPLQYLAWRIPWTEEPGGLQSMGSQRVGHD